MSWLAASLQNHTEIALFLALGLGQAAARLRIGSFKPNAVVLRASGWRGRWPTRH